MGAAGSGGQAGQGLASEVCQTSCGSLAARLALGMERKHGVVVRFLLGCVKAMRSWAFLDVSVDSVILYDNRASRSLQTINAGPEDAILRRALGQSAGNS